MSLIFFDTVLLTATFLCSLTAGFLLAFSIIVMPAINTLENSAFIDAFQRMDSIIQKGLPLFMLMWVGSAVSLLITMGLGFFHLSSSKLGVLVFCTIAYLIAVQLSTALINIPLNNQLQTMDCQNATDEALIKARSQFEVRWNKWNQRRSVVAILVSLLLIMIN